MSCLDSNDAPCVQVDAFTRMDVHHTHVGEKGWWLFPSEVCTCEVPPTSSGNAMVMDRNCPVHGLGAE